MGKWVISYTRECLQTLPYLKNKININSNGVHLNCMIYKRKEEEVEEEGEGGEERGMDEICISYH